MIRAPAHRRRRTMFHAIALFTVAVGLAAVFQNCRGAMQAISQSTSVTEVLVQSHLRDSSVRQSFHPRAIVVTPERIYFPDGSETPSPPSPTQGLAEALQIAYDQGLDLFVQPESNGNSEFHLRQPLFIPANQGKALQFKDVTLSFEDPAQAVLLEFDSSMMLDFRFRGRIQAAAPSPRIRFVPRTPHPLDGRLYGTLGVVNSRFSIEARTQKRIEIQFDTNSAEETPASIWGSTFFFDFPHSIVHLGTRFTPDNVVNQDSARLPLLEHDILRPDAVVVNPPAPGAPATQGEVYLPGGSHFPTPGTHTYGVQEAIEKARELGKDLIILGQGLQYSSIRWEGSTPRYPTDGFYFLDRPLVFEDLQRIRVRIFNATFNFSGERMPAAFWFRGADGLDFDLIGQIVHQNTERGFYFQPQPGQEIIGSRFRLGHGTNAAFDAHFGSIRHSFFAFTELWGAGSRDGITLFTPASGTCICDNQIQAVMVHGHPGTAVSIGHTRENAAQLARNTLLLGISSDSIHQTMGLRIWGSANSIVLKHLGSAERVVSFEPGSAGNSLQLTADTGRAGVHESTPGANAISLQAPIACGQSLEPPGIEYSQNGQTGTAVYRGDSAVHIQHRWNSRNAAEARLYYRHSSGPCPGSSAIEDSWQALNWGSRPSGAKDVVSDGAMWDGCTFEFKAVATHSCGSDITFLEQCWGSRCR